MKEKAHVAAINPKFTTTIDVMLGITSDVYITFIYLKYNLIIFIKYIRKIISNLFLRTGNFYVYW